METCHYLKIAIFPKELTLLMTHFLRKNDPFYNFSIFETWMTFFDTLEDALFLRGGLRLFLGVWLKVVRVFERRA